MALGTAGVELGHGTAATAPMINPSVCGSGFLFRALEGEREMKGFPRVLGVMGNRAGGTGP